MSSLSKFVLALTKKWLSDDLRQPGELISGFGMMTEILEFM